MKKLVLIFCFMFVFALGAFGSIWLPTEPIEDFIEAPLPHYSKILGYGWEINLPVNKPENVWNIPKVWRFEDTRFVFIDKDKDGNCDIVIAWSKTNNVNEKGQELWQQGPSAPCGIVEDAIAKFLIKANSEIPKNSEKKPVISPPSNLI